jgi:class 3 adenylate cyclase/tetratricopeptide (TPR) repeat protein
VTCPTCGAAVRAGRPFCGKCGTRLEAACPSCGAAPEAGDRFCGECGVPLGGEEPVEEAAGTPSSSPETEVRLISVLFVDLVGFTTLTESRDPEIVRELLDRYFSRARRVVERYGGIVEKFIGDAVMAVWGTPVARGDDAERAVRAALDLVDDVASLGQEEGVGDLHARAGVTTGRAAVTIGAAHQGMVVGDRVNTAARIQSVAPVGTVLVDEATRRATATAISYQDADELELKGKDEIVRVWRASRVVARRGGTFRAQGVEPPFVGRAREFRLVKDAFEGATEHGTAAMVAVVGQAGIGKSRLAWEFEKHVDGLIERVYWHRGRCLAYGDGVAYNALAEMVRGRADIVEDEDPTTARRKLANVVERYVEDEEERALILPRLGQLVGLEERNAPDQADLFPAWRLFIERIADQGTATLVFEDLQWADRGLLDFIDHLLDWSRDRSILVLTLARPEVVERVEWGPSLRNLTTIHLDPLPDEAMAELIAGLVPGLPEGVRARIADQAEGVPLYAVETVRMLLDQGQIVSGEVGYELAGADVELEMPESLQALVAARLDGLPAAERDLIQHAAVLGQSFTREGLRSLSSLGLSVLDEQLRMLRMKDLIGVDAASRGSDAGRYTFLQAMVRTVAYDMLSRHERKRRHLAAAEHLRGLPTADELAEVIATHLLDAYRADPHADDVEDIRREAREMLEKAADRAEALAALEEAQRCCDRAAELTDDPMDRARLVLRAGELASRAGDTDEAGKRLQAAAQAFSDLDHIRGEALAQAALARLDHDEGRLEEASERLAGAVAAMDPEAYPEEHARLAAELARHLFFLDQPEDMRPHLATALALAERDGLVEIIADGLITKSLLAEQEGRPEEAYALLRHAHDLAREHHLDHVLERAANNLSILLASRARWDDVREVLEQMVRRARRRGDRHTEKHALAFLAHTEMDTGDWERAADLLAEAAAVPLSTRWSQSIYLLAQLRIDVETGRFEEAEELLHVLEREGISDTQGTANLEISRVGLLNASGHHTEAVAAAEALLAGPSAHFLFIAPDRLAPAVDSALRVGDVTAARTLRDRIAEAASSSDVLSAAQVQLFDARLAAADGDPAAAELIRAAARRYDDLGVPVVAADARFALAEWLVEQELAEDAVEPLEEAIGTFERLGARQLEAARELRERIAATAGIATTSA